MLEHQGRLIPRVTLVVTAGLAVLSSSCESSGKSSSASSEIFPNQTQLSQRIGDARSTLERCSTPEIAEASQYFAYINNKSRLAVMLTDTGRSIGVVIAEVNGQKIADLSLSPKMLTDSSYPTENISKDLYDAIETYKKVEKQPEIYEIGQEIPTSSSINQEICPSQ